MDTRNSQKKSPRSSAKSKQDTTRAPEISQPYRKPSVDPDDEEKYMDYSFDHVARVRAARGAAQRAMESFGDVSEYDITIIQGQLKTEDPERVLQPSLDFESDASLDEQGKA